MDTFGNIFIPSNQHQIVKFDSIDFMPVPNSWGTGDSIDIKNNAVDGKIETAVILNCW